MQAVQNWNFGVAPAPEGGNSSLTSKKSPIARVLVVDDEALIRWTLAETLGERGYAVSEAGDARTALQAIEGSPDPFDIILLDYRLPDSNDLAVLSKIRFLAPATQVIMVTAHGSPELAEKATALGVYAMVSKPFEIESLAALVGRARVAGSPNGR